MPHRKKKPFIQKKKSVTFHLVHRSQKDPLVADETAPQRVLLPAERADVQKRKEEERKYGVFFDDAYNYLQHLKEASPVAELVASSAPLTETRVTVATGDGGVQEEEQPIPTHSINLPSSVFASEFEEETGLLNKAAPVRGPRLDLDPDIVAALDDDFDFDDPDNALEDDFVVKAVRRGNEEDAQEGCDDDDEEWEDTEDEDFDSAGALSDDDRPRVGSSDGGVREFLFMEEETRSRFTAYSMTSSVMRRNEQLTLLDDRFEKLYEEYDDDEIGALDHHELEGSIQVDSTRLGEVIADYHTQKAKDCQMPDDLGPRGDVLLKEEEEEGEEKVTMETLVSEEPTEQWDCESILSTYSNLYNHPKLITDPPKLNAIKVSDKTGIPLDVLSKRSLTAKQLERLETINVSDLPRASTQPRQRDESKDERKARKQAIKEERKERRVEKKANRTAFKVEKARQEQVVLNLRQNLQGIKL